MDANRRRPAKQDENLKLLVPGGLREENRFLLMFLEIVEKNPCLPAKSHEQFQLPTSV